MLRIITFKIFFSLILGLFSFYSFAQINENNDDRLQVTNYSNGLGQSIQFSDINGEVLINILLPSNQNRGNILIDHKRINIKQTVEVSVMNILGKEIHHFNLTQLKGRERYSMYGLQDGVYFYMVTINQEKVYTKRFLKK